MPDGGKERAKRKNPLVRASVPQSPSGRRLGCAECLAETTHTYCRLSLQRFLYAQSILSWLRIQVNKSRLRAARKALQSTVSDSEGAPCLISNAKRVTG
ncbi:hypothetical protein AOLI_G00048550 [Acnodon oligacanthus]